MGDMRNAYKILDGNLTETDHLGDVGAGGEVILKCILKSSVIRIWTGFIWLRIVSSF
jgi:hypothetical protein